MSHMTEPQEKLMLLDQKLTAAYVMFTDLQCRFLFDVSFYEERKNGVVGADRLCELMEEAQKKAYGPLIDESGLHPFFWASKLHFFLTSQPFYNFPYVFGYLFSGGVYDRAKKEGAAFADKYQALLSDTGVMTVEDLARRHMGVDLAGESFWRDAVARSIADVGDFVKLVNAIV